MAATQTIENEAPLVLDSEGGRVKTPKPFVGSQKYVRLKDRDGFVISWTPLLRLVPENMEVFESETPPPEYIPNLVDWMVQAQSQKAEAAATAKRGK
jgi:hypothetical protein